MSKLHNIIFDQDLSLKSFVYRIIAGLGGGLILGILTHSDNMGYQNIMTLIAGFIILVIGIFLLKNRKKTIIDERMYMVQNKSYSYSWFITFLFVILSGNYLESINSEIQVLTYSMIIMLFMAISNGLLYLYYKNK